MNGRVREMALRLHEALLVQDMYVDARGRRRRWTPTYLADRLRGDWPELARTDRRLVKAYALGRVAPTLDVLDAIAQTLNVPFAWLAGEGPARLEDFRWAYGDVLELG